MYQSSSLVIRKSIVAMRNLLLALIRLGQVVCLVRKLIRCPSFNVAVAQGTKILHLVNGGVLGVRAPQRGGCDRSMLPPCFRIEGRKASIYVQKFGKYISRRTQRVYGTRAGAKQTSPSLIWLDVEGGMGDKPIWTQL